jgi:hypothetical protein
MVATHTTEAPPLEYNRTQTASIVEIFASNWQLLTYANLTFQCSG